VSAVADVRPALIGHLKDLHLPTVRECYEETARRAERETLSYEACDIPNTCRAGVFLSYLRKDAAGYGRGPYDR
jgi:hypothetical protein